MSMMSPGVKAVEVDFSTYVAALPTTIVGCVGEATTGPLKPTLITNQRQLLETFGKPSASHYGIYSAMAMLEQVGTLYYQRAVDGTEKVATAGVDGTDKLLFSTKYKTSDLNGFTIDQSAPSVSATPNLPADIITIKLTDSDGKLLETYNVNMDEGSEYYAETVINLASSRIKVEVDPDGSADIAVKVLTLAGGNSGMDALNASSVIGNPGTVEGLQAFANSDTFDVNIIATPGWSDAAVINEAISLCEKRGDCIYVAETPFGLKPQEAIEWSNGEGEYTDHQAFNSSYAALYWSWVKVYDTFTKKDIWLPPTGYVIARIAFTDNTTEAWFAPAGLTRGRLAKPLALEYSPSSGERDELYKPGNIINSIVNFRGDGITIWGQRTMQRKPSATDRINVRRLLCISKKAVTASTMYLVFDQNDRITWDQWVNMVEPFFESIKSRRGLYDFKVIMDETTVTPYDIDNYRMPGKVMLKPTKSAEFIPLDFVLLSTGADFN